MIIIKESIRFTEYKVPSDIEATHVSVEYGNSSVHILNLYKPPGTNFPAEYLEEALTNKNTILVGDFSAHHVEWTATKSDANGTVLGKIAEIQGLQLMNNKEPTYISKEIGADSLTDLTFLSPNLAIKARTEVFNTNFDSDHFPVVTEIKGGLKENNRVRVTAELRENIVYESRWN